MLPAACAIMDTLRLSSFSGFFLFSFCIDIRQHAYAFLRSGKKNISLLLPRPKVFQTRVSGARSAMRQWMDVDVKHNMMWGSILISFGLGTGCNLTFFFCMSNIWRKTYQQPSNGPRKSFHAWTTNRDKNKNHARRMHQRAAWVLFVCFGVLEWMVCAPLSGKSGKGSSKHRQETPHQTPGIGFLTLLSFSCRFFYFPMGSRVSPLLTFIRQPKKKQTNHTPRCLVFVIQLLLSFFLWSSCPNKQLALTNLVEKLFIFSLDKGADVEFVNPFFFPFVQLNWKGGIEKRQCANELKAVFLAAAHRRGAITHSFFFTFFSCSSYGMMHMLANRKRKKEDGKKMSRGVITRRLRLGYVPSTT